MQDNPEDTQRALEAHHELHSDLDALTTVKEQFAGLNEGFDEFANFLSNGELSPQELEAFFDVVNSKRDVRNVKRDFEGQGYPKNRTEFTLFADKF